MNHNIVLGTVQFGVNYGVSNNSGKVAFEEVEKILNFAYKNGITLIDTAPGYGDAEKIIGKISKSSQLKFNIMTKSPPIANIIITNKDLDSLESSINSSLQYLGVNELTSVLTHGPNDFLLSGADKLYKKMLQLKEQNIIKNIGCSIYDPQQLKLITERYDIDDVQFPNNILDQRFNSKSNIELINNKNITTFARSAFLQGLLLMNLNELPAYFNPIKNKLRDLFLLAKSKKMTTYQLCLEYLKIQPHIDYMVLGVQSYEQLSQIINSLNSLNNYPKSKVTDFEIFSCDDESYINPSKWNLS